MTADEQMKFAERLKRAHPEWSKSFVSGYLHGVVDEDLRPRPLRRYVTQAERLNHYAFGYILGFAIHRGSDSELKTWFTVTGMRPKIEA